MIDPAQIAPTIAATWPPQSTAPCGPFTLFQAAGGGSRVRAARFGDMAANGAGVTQPQIAAAAARMRENGQPDLFMVFDWQAALDHALDAQGYTMRDRTLILAAECAALAAPPPPVTCFECWPPLAIQAEIWADGDIGPDRLAVMARVAGPRTSLFGRARDRPAATAFVATDGAVAMLHALVVTPRARRQGLARHMMRAAADWSMRQGCPWLATLVTEENEAARALYASLGFDAIGHYHYRLKEG